MRTSLTALLPLCAAACLSPESTGLHRAAPAATTVKLDFFHRPLPEIPLPIDLATRHDPASPTGLRINASMLAPTQMERTVRRMIDQLDGWGTLQPIVVPFSGPLDVRSVLAAHRDARYGFDDDVVYLVNVDRDSKHFGKLHALDFGNGSYPVALERLNQYWPNDPRGFTVSLAFEEADEDVNENGVLDLGEDADGDGQLGPGEDLDGDGVLDGPEDTDADGLLDAPNYLPGAAPAMADLGARYDALMTFYERQTNTLLMRPMEPLDERTTYAVVVTRRLKDESGQSVGSPYPFINHAAQTHALSALPDVLPAGLTLDDVAFAFAFTTQSSTSDMIAVRDGLYGHGVQKQLGEEYPPELKSLLRLRDRDRFPQGKNLHLMYGEQWAGALRAVRTELENVDESAEHFKRQMAVLDYVDFYVVGSFDSPQLFQREGPDGKWLPLDEQSWPKDISTTAAPARREEVFFTLLVPRKEVSARGQGKPAPLVIMSHGYTSNRFEVMQFGALMAKHGFAVLAIDGPSHGLPIDDAVRSLAKSMFKTHGLGGAADAVFKSRGYNQDFDPLNEIDSGADFWTAYLFHTRDVVRQFVLDYLQTVRVVRGFDGARRWQLGSCGADSLAGDFDCDGALDVGGGAELYMLGGSLGGISSMLVGALEPELTAIAPISGGAGFADIGVRTTQSGALEGFMLRAMSPLFLGTRDAATGTMKLEQLVTKLNDSATVPFADVTEVLPGDTMVVENLDNQERACGFVTADGRVRAALPSDEGNRVRVTFYKGPQLDGQPGCGLRPGAQVRREVSSFEREVTFGYLERGAPRVFAKGAALVALADGLGLRRGHPDLRRFQGLGQLVLDSCDPATYARHLFREPLTYPGTGQTTGTHALIITTLGDSAVSPSSGITYGRAAGTIGWEHDDPRFGKPMNQVLIDTYVAEGVDTYQRFVAPDGSGVHLDVESFSGGDDVWGASVPRFHTPLRGVAADPLGGTSGSLFPLPEPGGAHGFDMPGRMTDAARRAKGCPAACSMTAPASDPCSCSAAHFDLGEYMFNLIGRYFASSGKQVSFDLCLSRADCPGMPAKPSVRSGLELEQ